jgi:hypothetical protein
MTSKPSAWGFIKGAFIETVPDGSKPAPSGASGTGIVTRITPVPSAPTSAADPDVIAKLEARLQKAAPPAYLTYMEQCAALEEVIPDETTRIKAALKTSKCSKADLLSSIEVLLQAMEHAKDEFEGSFKKNRDAKLAEIQQTVTDGDSKIKNYEDQISSLQIQLEVAKTARAQAALQQTGESQRLEGIHSSFLAAYAQVTAHLSAQKTQIDSKT